MNACTAVHAVRAVHAGDPRNHVLLQHGPFADMDAALLVQLSNRLRAQSLPTFAVTGSEVRSPADRSPVPSHRRHDCRSGRRGRTGARHDRRLRPRCRSRRRLWTRHRPECSSCVPGTRSGELGPLALGRRTLRQAAGAPASAAFGRSLKAQTECCSVSPAWSRAARYL